MKFAETLYNISMGVLIIIGIYMLSIPIVDLYNSDKTDCNPLTVDVEINGEIVKMRGCIIDE